MIDPYKVLGISPSATNEEVKNAYRELAKKYHPDNYVGSPMADVAEEKMKEINEAYDTILEIRAGKSSSAGNGAGANHNSSHGASYESGGNAGDPYFSETRQNINSGRIKEAETFLNSVPTEKRNAEWCFLMACILTKKGYYFDALRFADTACNMAPGNTEFAALRDNLRRQSGSYGNVHPRNTAGCDMCDICSFLICLDCMCR